MLWPRLYQRMYPYYYNHVTNAFAPITYGDHAGGMGRYPRFEELECWTKRRPEDKDCRHGEGRDGQREALERVAGACARRGVRFRGW
ncbi:hypothetical protein PG988_012432 [Apiospora saccharicola]